MKREAPIGPINVVNRDTKKIHQLVVCLGLYTGTLGGDTRADHVVKTLSGDVSDDHD